jgi:hypothetical protein
MSKGEALRAAAELHNDWETVALCDRAEMGMIPYYVWVKLTVEQRERLGRVSQTQAGRSLAELMAPKPPPIPPAASRTTTAKLDDAIRDALRQTSRKQP